MIFTYRPRIVDCTAFRSSFNAGTVQRRYSRMLSVVMMLVWSSNGSAPPSLASVCPGEVERCQNDRTCVHSFVSGIGTFHRGQLPGPAAMCAMIRVWAVFVKLSHCVAPSPPPPPCSTTPRSTTTNHSAQFKDSSHHHRLTSQLKKKITDHAEPTHRPSTEHPPRSTDRTPTPTP